MSEPASPGWQRRDVLGGAALLALVIGIPVGIASLSAPQDGEEPSERQRTMIGAVAATMLPRTDTPAADAAVGDFVILALAHGLDGTRAPAATAAMPSFPNHRRKDGSLRYLDWLEADLDRAAGGDWLRHDAARRERTLTDFDAAAYADKGKDESPWRKLKGLILLGYYTSEIGASRELQFELVPGRFDPKVPLGPHARAFSSDWTAVEFG